MEDILKGSLRVTQALNRYEFGVELDLMREGVNRNKWDFRNLETLYETFVGKPILTAYVGNKVGDGHNMEERIDPLTGETTYSFTGATSERIVGTLSENKEDFTLEERDGHKWVKAKGKLFTFYAPELVDKIVRTGQMDVSVEIESTESSLDANGTEIITDWHGLGVTILGDDVAPAIPGAKIAKLAAIEKEFASLKLKAAALVEEDSLNKPHENKGVKNRMINKQTIARLAALFPNYSLLSVSEDEKTVCLMDSECRTFSYTFCEEDGDAIVENRIKPASTAVVWRVGDNEMTCDVQDIVACARKSEADYEVKLSAMQSELDKSNEKLSAMEAAQNEYRQNSVKSAVENAMQDIRMASDAEADAVKASADDMIAHPEVYACMVEDGKFVGAEKAREKLLAMASEKRMEIARGEADRKKTQFAWNSVRSEDGGVSGFSDSIKFIKS